MEYVIVVCFYFIVVGINVSAKVHGTHESFTKTIEKARVFDRERSAAGGRGCLITHPHQAGADTQGRALQRGAAASSPRREVPARVSSRHSASQKVRSVAERVKRATTQMELYGAQYNS